MHKRLALATLVLLAVYPGLAQAQQEQAKDRLTLQRRVARDQLTALELHAFTAVPAELVREVHD